MFDPQERVNFVTGFSKRKQERKEVAKKKSLAREREVRILLRQKRREARKRGVEAAAKVADKSEPEDTRQASPDHEASEGTEYP